MKSIRLVMVMLLALMLGTTAANAQISKVFKGAMKEASSVIKNDNKAIEKIPTTVEEFEALQAELGTTPEGCIMLQLIAMEMFRRDKEVGLQCLERNNTSTNLNDVKRRLTELFREGDSYARPYLVSSCFKGAKPSNGYNPNKPYSIEVRVNPAYPDEERSQMLKGYVKHMQLYSEGYDTPWRGIDVVKQQGDEYYRVSNCPAILTQCKEIDFDASDDWHGLE